MTTKTTTSKRRPSTTSKTHTSSKTDDLRSSANETPRRGRQLRVTGAGEAEQPKSRRFRPLAVTGIQLEEPAEVVETVPADAVVVEASSPAAASGRAKSSPAPEGMIKTLVRGSSAKALGWDVERPDWLPSPTIKSQGTAQESWRFDLAPAVLLRLVEFLEANAKIAVPVSKDAKYLRSLVPAAA
jgi:hypothetical protein